MKFFVAAYVFLLKGYSEQRTSCAMHEGEHDMEFFATMSIGGVSPQLECNHGQSVCPLQNITCQCVVTDEYPSLRWKLGSELIAAFDLFGQCTFAETNCSAATVAVLAIGLSSNISFVAELQPGPVTIECQGVGTISSSLSFSFGTCTSFWHLYIA